MNNKNKFEKILNVFFLLPCNKNTNLVLNIDKDAKTDSEKFYRIEIRKNNIDLSLFFADDRPLRGESIDIIIENLKKFTTFNRKT